MFKLVIQDDEGKTTVVPLIRDEITIGRKEGNTIRLTERNVSRRHARILRNNGEVHIEDLGSYNGIRVNNSRIAERVSLRVSDQVQIGDYKLYLKAEGVEQVDDARTMPIERITDQVAGDNAQTDVLNAVSATQTAPMGIPTTPTPGAGLAGQQLVGNPNRTLVAIADTDPQGRPLASAAAVAALSAPVGYGKLVVLSSNFAGKEFELSRPQMIVGRTDENDLVVNHRSISRNHAKLVREPDTGRYTISDLQSSNGVRVNGQDYGKVELRRGDVVDLGHVRLRFVEPGEDFVFARDAVITDVPDSGSKRGLLIAVALGLLVLGAAIVFFLTRKDETPDETAGGSGSSGMIASGSDGSQIAITDAVIDAPAPTINGSNGANGGESDEATRIALECDGHIQDKKWVDLEECATNKLAKFDTQKAKDLITRAKSEGAAEVALRELKDAIKDGNSKTAKLKHEKTKGSVYQREADDQYAPFFDKTVGAVVARLESKANECRDFNRVLSSETEARGKHVTDEARKKVQCRREQVAVKPGSNNPGSAVKNPDPPACDAEALKLQGRDAFQSGSYPQAVKLFEQSLSCKFDQSLVPSLVLAACNSKNTAKAKMYYPRLSTGQQASIVQRCLDNKIEPR
ncbi:MAG: FHA domain-containing protein [Kofleriaceae bacterium]